MGNETPKKSIDSVSKSEIEPLESDEAGALQGGFAELSSGLSEQSLGDINISKCHCTVQPTVPTTT